MHEFGIESSLLKAVLTGKKTIEVQLGTPGILKIRVGDNVAIREDTYEDGELISAKQSVAKVTIKQRLFFESFAEMIQTIDYTALVPEALSPNDALDVYEQFYTPEDEAEYGVVAFMFELAS